VRIRATLVVVSTRRYQPTPEDESWMQKALDLAKQSVAEPRDDGTVPPKVGVVAVLDGEVVGSAFRGQGGPGDHAEWSLIKALGEAAKDRLHGATIYTTLEPCTERSPGKKACANHLIDHGVARVFIGAYDPNPVVYRRGWRRLRDAGIELCDFTTELRARAWAILGPFRAPYESGAEHDRRATFDYSQSAGRYPVVAGGVEFGTEWGDCGATSIYAYGTTGQVALADGAENFHQVDDPGAYAFDRDFAQVEVGEIAIYREDSHYLLVQVVDLVPGPGRGFSHTSVTIEWEARIDD